MWHLLLGRAVLVRPIVIALSVFGVTALAARAADTDLARWTASPPEFSGAKVEGGTVQLQSGVFRTPESRPWKWVGWFHNPMARDVAVKTQLTIPRPASDFHWFGQSWSVWPDPTYGDGGASRPG